MELSRTTLRAVEWWAWASSVVPLINVLRDELLERPYLLIGRDHGAGAQRAWEDAGVEVSQLWAQMSAGPEPPIVLFEYDPTRSGEVPIRLLEGFDGALHCDGYSGYVPAGARVQPRAPGLLGSCETQFRRCAEKPRAQSEEAAAESAREGAPDPLLSYRKSERSMPSSAASATKPPEYRHLARQSESVAVLDALRAWLDDTIDKIPPSTVLGKAMAYLNKPVGRTGTLLRRRALRY